MAGDVVLPPDPVPPPHGAPPGRIVLPRDAAEDPVGPVLAEARVLHVCIGNLCRSPMAELLMREHLTARFGPGAETVEVLSAGTRARDGEQIWPPAAAELRRRGIASGEHRSRRLLGAYIERAHLVLAATRAERDEALALAPSALSRVFTWRELAILLDGVHPDEVPGLTVGSRVAALAGVAAARRSMVGPVEPGFLDIADPLGGTADDFRRAADEIAEAVTAILAPL